MEQLIIIKSIMKSHNYNTIRTLLKEEQGEKIAPYIFKLRNAQAIQEYLRQEKINYETYQAIQENQEEFAQEDEELEKAYQAASQDPERSKLVKRGQRVALKDLQKRLLEI
ncbi:MAG: hypothetical protein MRECE_9c038 [Mycoplasmataceae bacterium CE_OT135]|nr:MAG: hypothetical protein MRECE_44c005 [Mycoplasmataceae bacterium CE_OT135]KLL03779.1 MAG: hypothetical protein MRECE_9c038 [Mycoplasmataceae bacterium CE_OT135]